MDTKWVIAGKPDNAVPEVDRVYEIRDSRKGIFAGRIIPVSGEWATVERIEGQIHWASVENKVLYGSRPDAVSIRAGLVYTIELQEQPKDGAE